MSAVTTLLRRIAGSGARHAMRQAISRAAHAPRLPVLPAADQAVVAGLRQHGIHQTSLEALAASGVPGADRLLAAAVPLVRQLAAEPAGEVTPLHAPEADILRHQALPLWGLETRLLDIAESYIGLPVVYRGLVVRRDVADGHQVGTRHWHFDSEDRRILKIIVYLNDVGPQDGPFSYVPPALTRGIDFPVFGGSRVRDEDLQSRLADPEQRCIGPRGTVLFVDTCAMLHRGAVPVGSDRYTLFYAYNSTLPREAYHCGPLQPPAALRQLAALAPRQLAAIEFPY
jgi:hypothetical protein